MAQVTELWRRCAQLFMVGFDGFTPNDTIRRLIDDGIQGVILFKRNVADADSVAKLVKELKAYAGRPLVVAVDQEGGRVARLRGAPFTALPPMRQIGRTGDERLAYRAGKLLAFELRAMGFDWDFAPVLDVDTNPQNPVIGDRSFSHDADVVAQMGVALARGLEDGGVASCGKHFPGHGDTSQDSHLALPRLPHSLQRLREIELKPFLAFARANLASLMTAHVVFEALEPNVPATMSPRVLNELLRGELGFSGVLVSDDLEMKAIAEHHSIEKAVVDGTNATVDLFLVCHKDEVQRRAITALADAVESGRVSQARVEEAIGRLRALSARFVKDQTTNRLGSTEHQALREGLTDNAFAGRDPTER